MNRRWNDTADWCPVCGASICLKVDGTYYVHGPREDRCPGSNRLATIVEMGGVSNDNAEDRSSLDRLLRQIRGGAESVLYLPAEGDER